MHLHTKRRAVVAAAGIFLAAVPTAAHATSPASFNAGWGGFNWTWCNDAGGTTSCTFASDVLDLVEGRLHSSVSATAAPVSNGDGLMSPGVLKVWSLPHPAQRVTATFTVHVDSMTFSQSGPTGLEMAWVSAELDDFSCGDGCRTSEDEFLGLSDHLRPTKSGTFQVTVSLAMPDGSPLPAGKLRASLRLGTDAGGCCGTVYTGTNTADATVHVTDLSVVTS